MLLRLAAPLFLLVLAASPAMAVCPGPSVLYQDSFDQLQPTWGEPTENIKVANGALTLAPGVGNYTWAINNAGVYELRSPDFKGTVAPKFVTWLDRGTSSIKVFEGFFDFLSFQTLASRSENTALQEPSNFLILNSLSFFTRNLELMEKHERIHLFLDNDSAGQMHVELLQQRTGKVIDERHMYKDFKDLNEWLVEQYRSLRMRRRLRR